MAQYDIHGLCSQCGKFHDIYVRLDINKIFDVYTVSDAYEEGLIAPTGLIGIDQMICTNTQARLPLPSPDRLVLVRAGNTTVDLKNSG